MVKWKDTTSYSQSDRKRVPRVWSTNVGMLQVSVHRHIDFDPEQWLLSTVPALFEKVALASGEFALAKAQALALVQAACQEVIDAIDKDS
jgi:hypothetical protein